MEDEFGENAKAVFHLIQVNKKYREALERAERLCKEALPKFDWGKSALDNNAIRLLNEVPVEISAALNFRSSLQTGSK